MTTHVRTVGKGQEQESHPLFNAEAHARRVTDYLSGARTRPVMPARHATAQAKKPAHDSQFSFRGGWVRTYPTHFEPLPTDFLAQVSGAWDRARHGEGRLSEVKGKWVERLGGVSFADVDTGYLTYVKSLGYPISKLIAEWAQTPAGIRKFRDAQRDLERAKIDARMAEREGDTGAGSTFVAGDRESGFIPGVDDSTDDGWYSGARWIQHKTQPDFDPSPWTVCGMVVRSRGDLAFKGANLLPVEGRGEAERDWEPAPWQAYGFLRGMQRSGQTGWLTVRKSEPGVRAAVEVAVERTTHVGEKTVRQVVTDVTPTRIGEASVRVGYEVAVKYKPKSYSATVELPGQWLPSPTKTGETEFVNRHHWDAVTTGYIGLQSLLHALTERGLACLGTDIADPRQAVCEYAADLYNAMPTAKECDGALKQWRAEAGTLADRVVTLAAELADEAGKPRVVESSWDGRTFEVWVVRLAKLLLTVQAGKTPAVRDRVVSVKRPNPDVAICE